MRFEWDESKNRENLRRHNLDFEDAYIIFDGPMLTAVDDRFAYEEVRFIGFGFLRELIAAVVFTERDDDIIRVISLRRAVKSEREKFYEYLENELGSGENDV